MITVEHLKKSYKATGTLFGSTKKHVLKDVSFQLNRGECLGIVGESGSGKSTLSRILLGLERYDGGAIHIDGLPHKTWLKQNKGKFSVVFQDYRTSVNPNWTIGQILAEPLHMLRSASKDREQYDRREAIIMELLERVQLPSSYLNKYPHELSGGQLQRICIARALTTHPRYLILDEAISSLDVSVQSQILTLLQELQRDFQLTYLFIAHDLQAVAYLCNRLAFLRDGVIIEELDCNHFTCAQSEYVEKLVNSVLPFQSTFNTKNITM